MILPEDYVNLTYEFSDLGQLMIMLKHNTIRSPFYLLIWLLKFTYRSQTKSVNELKVKSSAKPNTDHHDGDLKITVLSFRDSAC